jgi:serine phosphatase RsbU (regulator of sigma subunit)
MPLIGTLLAFPLSGPASLFLAVYGSGVYGDFWTLFGGSLLVTVGSVGVGAMLVGVPFDLLVVRRRELSARQTAIARCMTYALVGGGDGFFVYHVVTRWILQVPPPDTLLPALLVWFPLGGATIGLGYTLYEQVLAQMHRSARLAQELAVARAIQQDLFPQHFPQVDGLAFAAHCTPARETGGDFYDLIYLGRGRVGVVVADVAGKSIAAALLMAHARALWRAEAATGASPGQVLARVNRALCQDIHSLAFVTLFYGIIDVSEPGVRFAAAGHPPPLLCHPLSASQRAGHALRELNANGLPLGLAPGAEYEETWVSLLPGDLLLLYTDGVVESLNAQRQMFGFERFQTTLAHIPADHPQNIIEEIRFTLDRFRGPVEQVDDVTMLAIQVERRDPLLSREGVGA